MKKWTLLCLLLLTVLFALPVYASDKGIQGTGDVVDIQTYWEENGYPESLSYIHQWGAEMATDDIKWLYWEIGVVDLDEQTKQEIIALASDTCWITFYDATFTYAQRLGVYEEISALDDEQIESVTLGVNTEMIFVTLQSNASSTTMARYEAEFEALYGMDFEVLNLTTVTTDTQYSYDAVDPVVTSNHLLWWAVAVTTGLLLLICLRQRQQVRQTTAGELQTTRYTRSTVRQAVRQTTVAPSDSVWQNIQARL